MLKIGEFSKIAQVSVKTLRYYDRVGLLKPAHIDRYSGYRYYSLDQLVRLNRILALKDLDFSLDQVSELLNTDLSSDALQNMLHSKALELDQHIRAQQGRLLRVQNRLKSIQESSQHNRSPVVLKTAPDQWIATIHHVLPSLSFLEEWQAAAIKDIRSFLDRRGYKPAGAELLIYHQDEYRESNLEVEVGMILPEAGLRQDQPLQGGGDSIRLHVLPGVNQLAACVTTDTGLLSETYAHLAHWTQTNGFQPIGPWRELTFIPEDPSAQRVIEVQRPVMEAITYYQPLEVNKMQPKIITKPAFTVVGLRYFGKNQNQEIPELWAQYNSHIEQHGSIKNETGEACIGLCITPDDEPIEGAFEYVAGVPVTEPDDIPEGFVVRQVPEHTYAVFAHQGDLASLGKTYQYIYETWLPQSGYQLAEKLDFEYYDDAFKDFAPDSVFYIYLPIK